MKMLVGPYFFTGPPSLHLVSSRAQRKKRVFLRLTISARRKQRKGRDPENTNGGGSGGSRKGGILIDYGACLSPSLLLFSLLLLDFFLLLLLLAARLSSPHRSEIQFPRSPPSPPASPPRSSPSSCPYCTGPSPPLPPIRNPSLPCETRGLERWSSHFIRLRWSLGGRRVPGINSLP